MTDQTYSGVRHDSSDVTADDFYLEGYLMRSSLWLNMELNIGWLLLLLAVTLAAR